MDNYNDLQQLAALLNPKKNPDDSSDEEADEQTEEGKLLNFNTRSK